tara:strand:- start:543 stop:1178 length:636 start_codon:yes stop_codon:yes gene_type:complete
MMQFQLFPSLNKSLSFDQNEILSSILQIEGLETFDADLTYGNGKFYKHLPQPKFKFDIDTDLIDCIAADSTKLPLQNGEISSCIFDPPFLTYVKSARKHDSIMAKRFGGYWHYDELRQHYTKTIKEAYRVLAPKGIFVIKCQDIIHNHRLHPTHVYTIQWAENLFNLKDLYILAAKSRMPMPQKENEARRIQRHARIFHSYFLVFQRNTDR